MTSALSELATEVGVQALFVWQWEPSKPAAQRQPQVAAPSSKIAAPSFWQAAGAVYVHARSSSPTVVQVEASPELKSVAQSVTGSVTAVAVQVSAPMVQTVQEVVCPAVAVVFPAGQAVHVKPAAVCVHARSLPSLAVQVAASPASKPVAQSVTGSVTAVAVHASMISV
jgi:hypothetical protein